MFTSVRTLVSLVLPCALALGLSDCRGGRFPVCENDEQCRSNPDIPSFKKYCVNLACVECRHDGDCQAGQTCHQLTHECREIM